MSAMQTLLEWIRAQGHLGPLFYIPVYVLGSCAFLPLFVFTLGAGYLFGVGWGTAVVWTASMIGATAGFWVGRRGAREWVLRKVRANPRMLALEEALGRDSWKLVLLSRMAPIFPFNLLNFALGASPVSFKVFAAASGLGMLPGIVMTVYTGSVAGDLTHLESAASRSTVYWAAYAVSAAATLGVTVYAARVIRRVLGGKKTADSKA